MTRRVGIVGAGIAGLTCARQLVAAGLDAVVWDKGRGPGGRMSTRRRGEGRFDHGAQYFSVRDSRFEAAVQQWRDEGVVAPWEARWARWDDGRIVPGEVRHPRWVGVPKMSSVVRHLTHGLEVHFGARVGSVTHQDGWRVTDVGGQVLGDVDAVVVAVPSPQAVPLLKEAPELQEAASAVVAEPCWALMARLDAPVAWDALRLDEGPLSWVARDSTKPGRPAGERWVAHASPDWSRAHLEDDPDDVARQLGRALTALTGGDILDATAHRWRYAQVVRPAEAGWDPRGLTWCGDGAAGGRVEAAYLSGLDAAERVIAALHVAGQP